MKRSSASVSSWSEAEEGEASMFCLGRVWSPSALQVMPDELPDKGVYHVLWEVVELLW